MVNPQLRAVWSTVSFYKINFNGRRAVVKFAKDYIRTCIKATQMPTHICIVIASKTKSSRECVTSQL